MSKREKGTVAAIIVAGILASIILYAGFWLDNKRLDRIQNENIQKSKNFLEFIYFVSNETELDIVLDAIAEDDLRGGIAVYIPFYKKSAQKDLIKKAVDRIMSTNYLPVYMYADHGNYDFSVADNLFDRKLKNCRPMGAAYILKTGERETDHIIGCISGGKETNTENKSRWFVNKSLEHLKKFTNENY